MKLRKLTGWQQLALETKARQLVGRVLSYNISLEDAWALANNTAFVFFAWENSGYSSPEELLENHSLEELLEICTKAKEMGQSHDN